VIPSCLIKAWHILAFSHDSSVPVLLEALSSPGKSFPFPTMETGTRACQREVLVSVKPLFSIIVKLSISYRLHEQRGSRER